jgi:hypothetical protein
MNEQEQSLKALQDIRQMMERSNRFISLSGWSGISAGLCALAGAAIARYYIGIYLLTRDTVSGLLLESQLMMVAAATFIAAFILAFLFTYIRSRKQGIPVWGAIAKRLLFNTAVPLLAGGMVAIRLLELQQYGMIAPLCLLFYGLALINGSKYTLGEVKYLGYSLLVLGIAGLWIPGYGLYFWALGFGLLHIIYGAVMWWKYEKRG